MSKRNSQEAKRAARERLRVEREKQAKKEKIRRQLIVGGSVVAVLAVAAGIGVAVANMGGDDNGDWDAAKSAKLVEPANTSGKQGTTVVIGEKDAPVLEIYEDMRCPTCAAFEQASGETVKKDIDKGKYKASFFMGTFLDNPNLAGGSGSKNALSALGAALDVSPEAFLDYKNVLYSEKNHPSESEDKFADDAYLLKVAKEVGELKGNTSFEKDVKEGTYDRWALEMSQKFDDSGVQGTPTFRMNGEKLEVEGAQEGTPIITPDQLNAAVDKALKKK